AVNFLLGEAAADLAVLPDLGVDRRRRHNEAVKDDGQVTLDLIGLGAGAAGHVLARHRAEEPAAGAVEREGDGRAEVLPLLTAGADEVIAGDARRLDFLVRDGILIHLRIARQDEILDLLLAAFFLGQVAVLALPAV